MRKRWPQAMMSVLLCCLPMSILAQESKAGKSNPIPVLYRITCWEVDDKTYDALRGKAKVNPAEIKGRRIQEAELLTTSNTESLFHLGQKEPIIYYDPRASQFQVQFVDTGFKLDIEWDGNVLQARPEVGDIESVVLSEENGRIARYPQTHVQISEVFLPGVKLGDSYLIGSGSGTITKSQVRVLDPAPKFGNLVLVLSLEAP